jgi:hypothetical protein
MLRSESWDRVSVRLARHFVRRSVLVAILGLLAATHAWAQATADNAGNSSSTQLEKVTVTAKKLEEQLRRHHIISLRLENVFDRQHASSLGTGVRDSDGSDYVYWNLGVPRTLSGRYTYKF